MNQGKLCESVSESSSVVADSLPPHGPHCPWNSLGWNTGVGSRSLLQGIFPTQESNPGLVHCGGFFTSWATREVIRQEIARVNTDILGISELKWTRMGDFNSDDHYIHYCGQESLRRNGVALIVNKRIQNAVLGCNLKNDRMISIHFQGKPFNITVIQVYAPTSNAEEAEVEWFHEELQDLLELIPPKIILFIIGNWNTKVGSQEITGITGKFGLGVQNEAGQRLTEFCQENELVIADTLF